jgi:hypothetical protein
MGRRITVVAAAMAVAVFSGPAFGQIIGAAGRGKIEWHSGYFPWNTPPGGIRLPPLPFLSAPLPLVLPNVFHLSPFGYAEGSGALGIAANAANYRVIIPGPPITHLLQLQSRPSLAATLDFQFDTVFRLGGGFPVHVARVAYPVIGTNGPGLGSSVRAQIFGQIWGLNAAGQVVWTRFLGDQFLTVRLGPFARLLAAQAIVPATPAGGRIVARGFLRLQASGRPIFFGAAGAPMSRANNLQADSSGTNVNGLSKDANGTDVCTAISLNGEPAGVGLPIMGLDPCLADIPDDVPHEDFPDDLQALLDSVDPPVEDLIYPDQDACTE